MNSSLEILEARIAPATLVGTNTVTFTDVDGDAVTVKTTAGTFVLATHFDFVGAGGNEQLRGINLGADAAFANANLTITAKAAGGGDGFVNVGAIRALIDLGAVKLDGDLGAIVAGDGAGTALKSLTVQSMGRFGTTTQDPGTATLISNLAGDLGGFTAKTDVQEVEFEVDGQIGKLTIGGSLVGGAADSSGAIAAGGQIGAVKIGRDIRGGGGFASGHVEAVAGIASLTIGGSLVGGAGERSGSVSSDASIGAVKIKRGISGGAGDHSGELSTGTTLGAVTLGGSLIGSSGLFSGRIAAVDDSAAIKIGGDVRGGSAENSGVIESDGAIKAIALGGSLVGGPASFTGTLFATTSIGAVTIAGDVIGGDSEFDGVTVEGTGAVRAGRLPSVTIADSVIAGAILSTTGKLTASGIVFASDDIGKLTIKGDLIGSADVAAQIIARGQANLAATATSDLAIASIKIGGSVDRAVIDAGFGLNADAQIGSVNVTGDWSRSILAAGVDPLSGFFDSATYTLIADADDRGNIRARIGALVIKGQALGSPDGSGEFAFVAQEIGSAKIGKRTVTLTTGPDVLALGTTGNLTLREI